MLNKLFVPVPFLLLVVLGQVAAQPVAARDQDTTGEYRVKVSENPLSAAVDARIPVKDGKLFIAAWGANQLPAGWATFVSEFAARDGSNRPLPFETKPNGVWQLTGGFTGIVRLSYKVDLSFTKNKWPYGNEQAGSFQDNALFVVSKALFVVSDVVGMRRIAFETPPTWKVSAPWQPLGSAPNAFVATDKDDLINNSLVMGKHVEYVFNEGNFTFILALFGRAANSRDLLAPTLQRVVRSYVRVFDKTPRSRYLMTVFYSDEADAEAYSKSSAFTEHDTITKNNLILWGNTLAHEFFHSWNGHAIRAEDYESTQWFSEGVTEYFANLALVQQGLISRDLFVKKMEKHFGLYLYFKTSPAFAGVTLKEAGARKGRNRLGVYNGGWAVAFCLDVLLREATQNRMNLADLMRLLYERFGLTGKKYLYDDLVIAATETAGRDMKDFFNLYVEGKELLPVQDYLKRAGFEGYTQFYDGEFYIFDSPTATAAQKTVQRSILTVN
jgi:predicted metalloprotease with PDZ domain